MSSLPTTNRPPFFQSAKVVLGGEVTTGDVFLLPPMRRRNASILAAASAWGHVVVRRQGRCDLTEVLAHQSCHFMRPLLVEANGVVCRFGI